MNIKSKLILGVGILFLLVILLTAVSMWYVNNLRDDTSNILTANYNTLEYCRNMMLSLDEIKFDPEAVQRFKTNLERQKLNETEPGEKEITERVEAEFMDAVLHPDDVTIKASIRKGISELLQLNLDAIKVKSEIASNTAESATIWIAVSGTFCFLAAFVLLVNLPGVVNPIRELTESIKQIASHNYNQRVYFEGHGEYRDLARSFNTMAEKLEEYAGSSVAQLLMEKKRIETLINNMNDPVIGLDEKGKILFANNEMLKIAGEGGSFVGENISGITIKNDLLRKLVQDPLEDHLSPQNNPPLKIFADAKESYFEKEVIPINIIPTGETESKRIGHVIILKNVTPFKELDSAKTNFIATISHELKTPIFSIQMGIQLFENSKTGHLNEDQLQLLEGIREDSNRLLKITGELLNMTQVETGNIQLNIHPSSPYPVLEYALTATKAQAEQRNIGFVIEKDDDLPDISMDPEKTAWVLTNFITNAIRYSYDNGKIIVSLKNSNNYIVFSVRDFGKGIDSKYRSRVFDRYFQIPGSSKSGTGLGLAISKDFIETQGGTINMESEMGLGSTFFFSFPVADKYNSI